MLGIERERESVCSCLCVNVGLSVCVFCMLERDDVESSVRCL